MERRRRQRRPPSTLTFRKRNNAVPSIDPDTNGRHVQNSRLGGGGVLTSFDIFVSWVKLRIEILAKIKGFFSFERLEY